VHPSGPPSSDSSCTQITCVFELDKGKFTGFDVPGPGPPEPRVHQQPGPDCGGTREAVADEGFRGFLRDRRGDFTRIDFPGAAGTQPNDINDRRQIVGTYSNANSCTGHAEDKRDFLLARGHFITIRVPDAAQTQAFCINNRGQVVGEYLDADGRFHGFRWDRGGSSPWAGQKVPPEHPLPTSTTAARLSASTRTPMPRRIASRALCGCR
jgi:probable HAF family extracellular repeat protein